MHFGNVTNSARLRSKDLNIKFLCMHAPRGNSGCEEHASEEIYCLNFLSGVWMTWPRFQNAYHKFCRNTTTYVSWPPVAPQWVELIVGGVGHTGGLTNSRSWRGTCQAGYSNTGGSPLSRKRAPFSKKSQQQFRMGLIKTLGNSLYLTKLNVAWLQRLWANLNFPFDTLIAMFVLKYKT